LYKLLIKTFLSAHDFGILRGSFAFGELKRRENIFELRMSVRHLSVSEMRSVLSQIFFIIKFTLADPINISCLVPLGY
jgi:hypothetical protein